MGESSRSETQVVEGRERGGRQVLSSVPSQPSARGELARLLGVLREQLPALRARYKVSQLWLFGSYVRHEQTADSDLDALVEFEEPPSLFVYIELQHSLSDLLGIPVDLVMRSALKPRIGRQILQEVVLV